MDRSIMLPKLTICCSKCFILESTIIGSDAKLLRARAIDQVTGGSTGKDARSTWRALRIVNELKEQLSSFLRTYLGNKVARIFS